MEEIYNLNKESSWVGAPHVTYHKTTTLKCIECSKQAPGTLTSGGGGEI